MAHKHHKWISQVATFELDGSFHRQKHWWRCTYCGSRIDSMIKPKSRRDYRKLNIGRTCELELIRQIHDA